MSEHAKTIARNFLEAQDRLRGGPDAALCADDYMFYAGSFPPMNLAGHQALASEFYGAFSDLHQTIEEVIAEGDRAVVRFRIKGTHDGDLMGTPPSGKPIDIGGFALMRIRDGKIVELREEFDQFGLLQQIGTLPAT
jgi:steroid delta-isomerase-like uncharacterized protein